MDGTGERIEAGQPELRAGERTLDVLDLFGRRLMIGLALAGGLPALAIWARPEPKHFEAFVAGDEVIRVNTRTGTVVACNAARCMQVLERGQKLKSYREGGLFQGASEAAPALAAPAAPAASAATAAPTAPPAPARPAAPVPESGGR